MHIKRFDRSCIKICIRRHAFHQTEWTDVANWVKVCPSGCRFRLFLQTRTGSGSHDLNQQTHLSFQKHEKKNHSTDRTMDEWKESKERSSPRPPPRTRDPQILDSHSRSLQFFFFFLFFFYTLIIILVKSKVHHKQLSH